jgi:chemotaxis protein CheZ
MSDAADDLEALFDEVASHRTETVAPPAGVTAAAPGGGAADDLEALFDEVASHRTETVVPQTGEMAADAAEDQSDKPMYERLGGIVRMLHDSLRQLGYDRSLADVASQITDAQGRLEHIGSLTEQAANKVLNAVDTSIPKQDALSKSAKDMQDRWNQLFEGKLSIEQFKALAGDSRQFAAIVVEASEAEKARLLDIMMAQDFQDITGQLIKKIVTITSSAEHELAQLLRDNAPPEVKAAIADSKPVELMTGPSSPGIAMVQDDVDSLLADLGF